MVTMDWTTFIVNAPLLAGFVYFALKMSDRLAATQKAFLDALERRDQFYEARNQALITALNANTTATNKLIEQNCAHDAATAQALRDILSDRPTQPVGKPQH